jgi:hypothetical protein
MTYRRNICLILMFLLSLAPLSTAQTAYTTTYNYVVTFYPRWFHVHSVRYRRSQPVNWSRPDQSPSITPW